MTPRPSDSAAFEPVSTLAELDALNEDKILEGYQSAEAGDPEPGANRGKAFWHGWRNRMIDIGAIPHDAESVRLVREFVKRARSMPAPSGEEK